MTIKNLILTLPVFLVVMLALAGCGVTSDPEQTAVPSQAVVIGETSIVIEERQLNICMAEEPESLFIYDSSSDGAASIFQALYEGSFDLLSYESRPVILEKVPSLLDGDARFEAVSVALGDNMVDAAGNVTRLGAGISYLPSGCRDGSCAVLYEGGQTGEVVMDQLVVNYALLGGVAWSDGKMVTAGDSVFSYELAKSLSARVHKELMERTSAYLATDELSVEWRGLPGFRDPDYATNFFSPLPSHAWGEMSAEQIAVSDVANKTPLGYGAYAIGEWLPGQRITMIKNPSYYRAEEGLPNFDSLVYHFVGTDAGTAIDFLLAGACDILDKSIDLTSQLERLTELQAQGQILLSSAPGNSWEHLDFGIVPINYDDFYNTAQGDRPNFFGDVRTRQAVAMCLDRSALIEQLSFGQGEVMHSYIATWHPLFNSDAATYSYDPAGAAMLLEQVGWVMGETGVRFAQDIVGIPNGSALAFGYFTTSSAFHQQIAQALGRSLLSCGIKINIASGTAQELFAPGPEGLLFGRKFDLAQFAWPLDQNPSCYLFFSNAIPGGDIERFPYSWGGWNLTGWNNPDYDAACQAAQNGLPGEEDYLANYYLAQQIFSSELPVIPLFIAAKFAVARPDLCNLEFDATAHILWNLENLDYGENC